MFALRFAPAGAGPTYALASGAELQIGSVELPRRHVARSPLQRFRGPDTDVLAVDWLAPAVALGGCRRGDVVLADRRLGGGDGSGPGTERPRAPAVLRCRGAVAHLRAIDPWRLLAAGPEHNLHMYDLRYARDPASGRGRATAAAAAASTPYRSYPAYVNKARTDLGFDVSPALGLVAAATDDRRVRTWDLWSGAEVPTAYGRRRWHRHVAAVAFVRDGAPADAKHPGVAIAADRGLEEWGIGGADEDG